MRFKFCGGTDVPEWVLAEVSLLSKISSVRMKVLCKQVIRRLVGEGLDFTKIQKLTTRDGSFTLSDVKALIAAVDYILAGAARFDVAPDDLNVELQQLGLPKENAVGIVRPYRSALAELRAHLRKQAIQLPRVDRLDWRVDAILGSSVRGDGRGGAGAGSAAGEGGGAVPVVQLQLRLSHDLQRRHPSAALDQDVGDTAAGGVREALKAVHSVELPADKFRVLHAELRAARALMASLEE